MPYRRRSDLPAPVRSALPVEAQDVWRKAFNAAHAAGNSESIAAAKGWADVRRAGWSKNEEGKWVKTQEAAPIVTDHRSARLREAVSLRNIEQAIDGGLTRWAKTAYAALGNSLEVWPVEVYGDYVVAKVRIYDREKDPGFVGERWVRSFYTVGEDATIVLSPPQEVEQVWVPSEGSGTSGLKVVMGTQESTSPADRRPAELREAVSFHTIADLIRGQAATMFPERDLFIDELYQEYAILRVSRHDPRTGGLIERRLYRVFYTTEGNDVTIETPEEVEPDYRPVSSSNGQARESGTPADAVLSEWVPLKEASRDGKRVECVILREGWGNPKDKHYYPRETLQREAEAFAGVKMYADHPTPAEEAQRPERSIRDLVAVIESARYEPQGPGGVPAIVGVARIIAPWFEPFLEAAWQHLGVSINGGGKVRPGTIDGKPARIVEAIPVKSSVDFVTAAGAGGQVTRILESLRGTREGVVDVELKDLTLDQLQESRKDLVEAVVKGVTLEQLKETRADLVEAIRKEEKQKVYGEKDQLTERMTETEKQLKTVQAENAKLSERLLLNDQMAVVDARLREAKLPEFVQDRLRKQFAGQLCRKDDGQLDTPKLTEALDTAIKDERTYIARLTESGKVRGMGASADGDGAAPVKEQVREGLYGLFGLQGEEKPAAQDGKTDEK